MEDGNNIKIFSAADIERYHKGLMSVAEMHALEKAAMDDPFLADALDGYKIAGNASGDLTDLRNRLAERTGEAKLVFMSNQKRFYWMRVAAMIVVVAGAGTLAYTLLNNKTTGIAKEQNTAATTVTDSASPSDTSEFKSLNADSINLNGNGTVVTKDSSLNYYNNKAAGLAIVTDTLKTNAENISPAYVTFERDSIPVREFANTTKDLSKETVSVPVKATAAPAAAEKLDDNAKQKQESDLVVLDKRQADKKAVEFKKTSDRPASGYADINAQNNQGVIANNRLAKSKPDTTNYRNLNIFRGRVTDAYNNAISFANVNVPEVNVGTYADSKGYFTLVAPDSVLNVNLRAVGFNNSQFQLRNNLQSNQLILQEDKTLEAIVMSNAKPNTSRSRTADMVLTEPEPDDGWEKYDSYLVNNIKVPQIDEVPLKEKTNGRGVVELSFDVNSNGEPINIKVTKSLCDKCDQEAIRLVKEGPKWKKKNRNRKATVTIPF
jgi:TonB family protein